MNTLAHTKPVGVGVNFRHELASELVRHIEAFDLFEVITDTLLIGGELDDALSQVLQSKPVVFHGLRTSLGAAEALDADYVEAVLAVVTRWNPRWFSDHLAFCRVGDLDVDQLMPVRRTVANAQRIAQKIRHLRSLTAVPFLIENITYYFDYGQAHTQLSEAAFINQILSDADCGLLLDVNNLHINARNHDFDPCAFIAELDLVRVKEIHLAGGYDRESVLIDSHGHCISEPVWELLEYVCQEARPLAIIIEREANFDFVELLESVARAREIFVRCWARERDHDASRDAMRTAALP